MSGWELEMEGGVLGKSGELLLVQIGCGLRGPQN